MSLKFQSTPSLGDAFVLPTGVLETLAARVRGSSVLLTALRPDGTPAYFDQAAGPCFRHYVLPLLDRIAKLDPDFLERARAIQPGSPAPVTEALPGLVCAAVPHIERRQVQSVVILAAKHRDFG